MKLRQEEIEIKKRVRHNYWNLTSQHGYDSGKSLLLFNLINGFYLSPFPPRHTHNTDKVVVRPLSNFQSNISVVSAQIHKIIKARFFSSIPFTPTFSNFNLLNLICWVLSVSYYFIIILQYIYIIYIIIINNSNNYGSIE